MTRRNAMTLTLLTATAAMFTAGGCSQRDATGRCVDQNGNLLPSSYCSSGGAGSYYYGGRTIYPRQVYGGTVSGGRVSGYSGTAEGARGGGIFRGGFGFHGGFGSRGG